MDKIGPTGKFPKGKARPDDEGELRVAIGHKDGKVFVHYGVPIKWIAFDPNEAEDFAKTIQMHANDAKAEIGEK